MSKRTWFVLPLVVFAACAELDPREKKCSGIAEFLYTPTPTMCQDFVNDEPRWKQYGTLENCIGMVEKHKDRVGRMCLAYFEERERQAQHDAEIARILSETGRRIGADIARVPYEP